MYTTPPLSKELFYIPPPSSFIIPIFRAPTTTTTLKTTTSKFLTAILKQDQKFNEITSTPSTNMISQRIFENLILTNTIVAAFCIILMITLTAFLIFLLIPSIRRRWINEKQNNNQKRFDDSTTLSRQQFTLGPSRINPLFDSTTANTSSPTTTQLTSYFQPHPTATVIHPTIWTPVTLQQTQLTSPTPSAATPLTTTTATNTNKLTTAPTIATTSAQTTTTGRPPLPSHPPTAVQRSPKKR